MATIDGCYCNQAPGVMNGPWQHRSTASCNPNYLSHAKHSFIVQCRDMSLSWVSLHIHLHSSRMLYYDNHHMHMHQACYALNCKQTQLPVIDQLTQPSLYNPATGAATEQINHVTSCVSWVPPDDLLIAFINLMVLSLQGLLTAAAAPVVKASHG